MIFDTDILVWIQKGNEKAAKAIDNTEEKAISILSYMELLQGAQNKKQHAYIKDFLYEYNFLVLPITENIGHRAAIYIEEYSLTSGIRAGDAIIAATAVEHNFELLSSNEKHNRCVKELRFKPFKP